MLENVLDKDFVRQFLIEQKHTYEELVTEFKARHPNLKGCSLRSVKRFCNHQGIKKRMPVLDEALSLRALLSTSRRKTFSFIFCPSKGLRTHVSKIVWLLSNSLFWVATSQKSFLACGPFVQIGEFWYANYGRREGSPLITLVWKIFQLKFPYFVCELTEYIL